ncbi:hypothetical protein [Streptomyces sp. NPDC041003]|uniref:hypothetical protein n=1 Tax=Streptomyces sp. NPDC041003 TaxID=3155730 RepID=UPI0033DC2645
MAEVYATLLRYAPYIADLTSPQTHEKGHPPPDLDVRIDLATSPATATARAPQAREVLILYGWIATTGPAGRTYALPRETSESDTVAITVMGVANGCSPRACRGCDSESALMQDDFGLAT